MKTLNGPWQVVRSGSVSVPIYRNAHASNKSGATYVVSWYAPTGRKRAKFVDSAAAIEEARLRAGQLSSGKAEASDVSRTDRDELHAARKLAGTTPLLAAMREWATASELAQGQVLAACEMWKARHRGAIDRATMGDVLDRFFKEKKKAGYATENNHGSILEAARREFGTYQIAQISASMLDAYLGKISNAVTRNTHRKRLVTLWRWARSKNLLPRDAVPEAEQTSRAREEAPEVGIISAETFGQLLELVRAKAPADLAAVVLAGFTGMRRVEVHGQLWSDVKLEQKHVRVSSAKKGTPARRLIPLCDAAIEWLMLCPNREGPVSDGVALDRARKLGREAKPKLTLPDNALRHSYISNHVVALGNVSQAALDAGNSPGIIHRHYRELVTKTEAAQWFAIRPAEAGEIIEMARGGA